MKADNKKKTFSTRIENELLARIYLRGGKIPKKFAKRNIDRSIVVQRKMLQR